MPSMYFIATLLPEEINQKILPLKQWMFEKYKCKVGLNSPAHITLLPPCWLDEEMETKLMQDLDQLADTLTSFQASTDNFSCFKPSTIFIAIKENEELKNIKTRTDEFFLQRPGYKLKFDTRPFHPHITIATRDLFKKSFYEAWESFSKMKFEASWEVNSISLLKHNKKNWDVVHTSQFSKTI